VTKSDLTKHKLQLLALKESYHKKKLICHKQIACQRQGSAAALLYEQVAQLSLTNPRDALHHGKRQILPTVT